MNPMTPKLMTLGFGTELIYTFIIILCSLMIYLGTKELYELSSYKGIKYFRQAFLFFAIAYFFRSFIKSILILFNIKEIFNLPFRFFGAFTMFIFIYASSIAIFYLLYSFSWKKFHKFKISTLHITALLIAFLSISSRNGFVYLGLNLFILLVVLYVTFSCYKTSRNKKNNLFAVYILLFLFWVLNILDILIPKFFQKFQIFIYLASIFLFLIILYKVLKKTGPD